MFSSPCYLFFGCPGQGNVTQPEALAVTLLYELLIEADVLRMAGALHAVVSGAVVQRGIFYCDDKGAGFNFRNSLAVTTAFLPLAKATSIEPFLPRIHLLWRRTAEQGCFFNGAAVLRSPR